MSIGRDEWIKFTGGPFEPYEERLHVSMSDKGKILMNRRAYELIGSPPRIMLYFKPDSGKIGISPAHERLATGFRVREYSGSAVAHCSTFVRHFGISLTGTHKFVGVDLSSEGYLQLDLAKTIQVGGQKRRRKK
ncbi:MAG: hypothetical protein IPG22_18920 [Acidobacteria bacterium]|nr:hypothetical protein [Acidobacteriota bacterium]